MLRHIRQVPQYGTTSNAVKQNHEFNETRMDPTGQYYEVVSIWVNSTTHEYTFTKLKHFSWYMFDIQACREPEIDNSAPNCSEIEWTYERTLMLSKYMLL